MGDKLGASSLTDSDAPAATRYACLQGRCGPCPHLAMTRSEHGKAARFLVATAALRIRKEGRRDGEETGEAEELVERPIKTATEGGGTNGGGDHLAIVRTLEKWAPRGVKPKGRPCNCKCQVTGARK